MGSGESVRIRFVRCPSCRQILPEPTNVPVYQCANCGKLLRAKIRNTDATPTPGLHDADTAQNATLHNVSTEKECSSSTHAGSLNSSGECSSDQNDGGNQLFSQNGNSGELHAVNLLNEEKSDVSDQDADQLGALNQSNGNIKDVADKRELESPSSVKLRDVNVFYEDINNGNDQTESSCSVIEQHGDINNGNDQTESSCSVIEQHGVCHDAGSSTELPQSENEELSQVAVAETEVTEALAGSKAQAHMKSKFDYELRISSSDELIDEKETGLSSIRMHRLARESISSDLVSSANEESEPIQENVQQGFNRVTYTDTFGAANVVNHGSELSGDLMDLSKSPISRSVRAYYDDGVSSGEGTDDQFHGRHQHKSKSPYKASNYAASEERQKREKFHANRSSEINDQFRNQETNWGRFERDKYISRLQFHQRGFQTDYQSCNTSNPPLSAFRYNSSSHSHDQPVYSEHEKIKLLRMFYDLQDQLNKACFVNEKTNGRSPAVDNWKDHHVPMYFGREAFEEDFHNYSGYPGNFMEDSNWPQQGTHLHMPFRGEATFSRHQIDYSMRCCPQVKRYSAQLPLAGCHSTNDFRKVPSGINFSSSHGSCPKSPQCHEDSEFPMYYRGTLSDDKRHQENAAKNYVREKYYPGKRHLRPVAGGAPFITCPSCFKQLQLPAYFLLFERRCHRVQCGACSELLKFSLVDGIHLVPYTPSVEAPPRSGIDEYSEAGNVRPFTPAFHGHHSSEADHVSCSNDCWVSRRKNCSTERDANFQTTERNESYASLEDRKELASGGRHKIYGIGSTCASPGRRSGMSKGKKVYSESEELQKDGGSPLHRLMGYYSASELIYNLESCSSSSWGTY